MGSTGASARGVAWLLLGCVAAATPTGVSAQVRSGVAAFQIPTPVANAAVVTLIQATQPDLATSATLMAHGDPMADASSRLPSSDATELALRQAALRALWPADIVQRSDDYLRRYPDHAGAAEVLTLRRRASTTAGLLRRNDVDLFRTAFVPQPPDGPAADDLRRAALGDADVAFSLAQQPQALDSTSRRKVGWLQYATLLGSDRAAYALSLYYRRESQPLMAAQFEARAVALGYQPPAALDNARK